MEPFLGTVCLFGFNFVPRGWAACNGQLLPIAQNTALFALLGTTYGGDGRTTFALPNLQGRVAVGFGQGPGLSNRPIGQQIGAETVTLSEAQLPAHTHATDYHLPQAAAPATPSADMPVAYNPEPGVAAVSHPSKPAGGNQPVSVMQPTLVLNYCIAIEGIFPSRN